MFKNRALQVRLTKIDPESPEAMDEVPVLSVEEINEILSVQVKNVAIAVGTVFVAVKVVDAVCTVGVLAANRKFQ